METQYISLNMTPTGVNPCFHISQYDVGRMLGFIVHSGGATVDLDTYTCTIEATRSDGTAITSAVATTDNIGTFEVTPTMSNKADKYRCQLVIVDENSKRIASLPFDIEVTKAAMDENSEAIEEDASLYQQYTEAVQGAIAEANADIQAEENARIAAVNAEATARQNADATLQNNIDAEATARQSADNTLQGNINSEAATRASADSNLQSQINQIIAPSGEAPSAAEVQNARIGADGVTYDTLGNAIRTQVGNLRGFEKNVLNSIGTNLITSTLENTTLNGLTIKKRYDAIGNLKYIIDGTASAQTILYLQIGLIIPFDTWLGKAPVGASDSTFMIIANNTITSVFYKAYESDIAIPSGTYDVYILIRSGQVLDNVEFYPIIFTTGIEKITNNVHKNDVLLSSFLELDLNARYNLYNKDDIVENKYLSDNIGISSIETFNTSQTTFVSNIIPTYDKYEKIYLNSNGVFCGFYGINGILLDKTVNNQSEVSVPNGTYYIRLYASNDVKNGLIVSLNPVGSKYDYKNLNIFANQPLVGKKWVALGDSLTEINNTASRNYTILCSEQIGLNCVNMGVSGTGYWKKHNIGQSFMDRALNIPTDAEVVTIFGSGNDMKNDDGEVPTDNMIGNSSDSTLDTWCGYVNQTIDNVIARVPDVRLGIISPTPWSGTPPTFNNTMKKMSEKLKEICERRSIPFLNLYLMSNLRPWDPNQNDCFAEGDITTNTHPNNKGNLIYYGRIREFLKSL